MFFIIYNTIKIKKMKSVDSKFKNYILKITTIFIFLNCIPMMSGNLSLMNTSNKSDLNLKKFKMLFRFHLPTVRTDMNHPLNSFNYKNVLMTTSQMVLFVSGDPYYSRPDEEWNTSNYIYTIRYENLDLPCLKRSYVCTHAQFVKEYKLFYPELNYEIPAEIVQRFDTSINASNNCLIIFESPPVSVAEAAWLCHEDLEILFSFQEALSRKIEDSNNTKYSFIADYLESRNKRVTGIVTLENEKFQFREIANSASNFSINYVDICPYVLSMYLREKLIWEGSYERPDESRCFKIQRKGQSYVNIPDYFCIFYSRNDYSMIQPLNVVQARYEAEMYANKINLRLQKINLSKSLEILSNSSSSMDIDGNVLAPIKVEIRTESFKFRHNMLSLLKLGKISKIEADDQIEKSKEKIINSVCLSLENCIKGIKYSVEKGLLPLDGYRDKFAFDLQNPFNTMIPKVNVKIDIKSDNISKKLLNEVTSMINGEGKNSLDYVPESAPGEIPNATAIKKAFNTFQELRDPSRIYYMIEELGQNCRLNVRKNSNSLKRKIAMLSYVGVNDPLFKYLGKIRMINKNPKRGS